MFLGAYDFTGDPTGLLAAYDRMMATMPVDALMIHICVERDDGITIYDTCPDADVFAAFSSGDAVRETMRDAGLPEPVVRPIGAVHVVRDGATVLGPTDQS